MGNIGQIYDKHNICEIRNCDMPKHWSKISRKKHPNQYKELFFIRNLKFQMKLKKEKDWKNTDLPWLTKFYKIMPHD